MDNADPYRGQRLTVRRAADGLETKSELAIAPKDHFASEMDHMADCVINDRNPKTPGEEGLRDMEIMEAIYRSAQNRTPIDI